MIWSTIIATVLCAIMYRLGGMGSGPGQKRIPWLPKIAFNGKVRDWGIPMVCLLWLSLHYGLVWWQYIGIFGIMWACLTTYWDDLFGYDNFYFHLFCVGLAMLVCLGTIEWYSVVIRAVAMALIGGLICSNTANDDIEELSRGAVIALTLPILFL